MEREGEEKTKHLLACEGYNGCAKTVHSHYGLQTAEQPQSVLLERCLERGNIMEQIRNVDVLIWDEISMSSRRLLNLVNLLHQEISKNPFPFGGLQVILVGDFWQLKPIRSRWDNGEPVYESKLFGEVFSHRFELKKILRQDEIEMEFKEALDIIRSGKCDDKTERYLCNQSEEFSPGDDSIIHIFFKRLPVEVYNATILSSLPGSKLTFHSLDTGNAKSLDKSISEVLCLKPNCKVMLLYNISQRLRNGTCGEFVGVNLDGEGLLVNFRNVGLVVVQRRVWYQYDAAGKVTGSRTQFPLTLAYAITAHKSQGLTMKRIVVHCSPEFIPGQTYVAISRVQRKDDVRLVGFRKNFLIPHPLSLTDLITTSSDEPLRTFRCCRKREINGPCYFDIDEDSESYVDDQSNVHIGDYDESLHFEAVARQFFESAEGVALNLEDVLICLTDFTHELSRPPLEFSIKTFIEMSKKGNDPFSQSINSAAQFALENLETFQIVACILWCRVATIFNDYLVYNLNEVHMTN